MKICRSLNSVPKYPNWKFFRTLSKSIREYREGDSVLPKEMLESYVNALHRFEPFCPFICNKVFKGMSLEKLV